MVFRWLTGRRRTKILANEFPPAWTEYLEKNVAAYDLLSAEEKKALRDLIQVFIAEKNFEGCGSLELTDEMKVTIAGTGCVMLLGRDHDLFSEVVSILVYPSTIVARDLGRSVFDTSGRVVEEAKVVLGQAVKGGAVILAWDSALVGARDAHDGRNVVIHELAHKIDFIDGHADGTPEFESHEQRRAWAAAMEPAFLAQKARAEKGKKSLLDDYAVTNEAEYFAVASEVFFEKPKALAKQLPDVYKSLAAFYNLDLAARVAQPEPVKKLAKPGVAKLKAKPDAGKPKGPPARKSEPVIAAQPKARKSEPVIAAPQSKARKSEPVIATQSKGRRSEPAIAASQPKSRKSEPVIAAQPKARKSEPAIAGSQPKTRKSEPVIAATQPKTRKSEPVIPTAAPRFRKTAAMAVVSLPDDD